MTIIDTLLGFAILLGVPGGLAIAVSFIFDTDQRAANERGIG